MLLPPSRGLQAYIIGAHMLLPRSRDVMLTFLRRARVVAAPDELPGLLRVPGRGEAGRARLLRRPGLQSNQERKPQFKLHKKYL